MRAVRLTAGPITVKPAVAADIAVHDVADMERQAVLDARRAPCVAPLVLLGERGLRAFGGFERPGTDSRGVLANGKDRDRR